ncbi:flagellar assembly protein FliH [Bacillus sp. CGMCC 1.16541]|uniref:flagellar assembly protein FliH n=1 Tax=Bacillus sp. CGMCC 1.16541 TaxID=2185143 RepID=UPI0013A5B423|nr:flagellar assembly protein FliH [Bacillus sp. CGMCC 1.16541]
MSNIIKASYAEKERAKKEIVIKSLSYGKQVNTEKEETAEQIIKRAKRQSDQLQQEAEALLVEARNQIELERQQWEQEKEYLEQEAMQKGYEDGVEQGKKAGYADYEALISEAVTITNQTKESYYDYLQQSEEVIFQLGFTLAQKIIDQQFNVDKTSYLSMVKSAIKEVRDEREIQLFVSPTYYEIVHDQKQQLLSLLNGEATLFIYVDEGLSTHGCILESAFGRIDVSVDSQLNELKQKLAELLMGDMSRESRTTN